MRRCALVCFLALVGFTFAQQKEIESQPAVVLSNGKLELTVALTGATLINLALHDDPGRLSPLWNEAPADQAGGEEIPAADAIGHFFRLGGFGSSSQEEPGNRHSVYGESGRQHFEVLISTRVPPFSVTMFGAQLPLGNELVTRMVQMVDGENIAYIETQVENLLASDRSISWAEHITLGPPFLEPGKVLVDLSDSRINTDRVYGYATALRQDKRLLFGYVFRRQDFPRLIDYTGNEKGTREIEFSTQSSEPSRREAVDAHDNFGTAAYHRLPAKSKITRRFLLFYTKVPDHFDVVADVVLENKQLKIRSKAGQVIVLNARLPL